MPIAIRLVAIACVLGALPLRAQQTLPTDKLDPAVRAAMTAGQSASVVILGSNQLLGRARGLDSLVAAHPDADRCVLRAALVTRMKAIASEQQPRIAATLNVTPARSLWIVNAIVATLTPEQIRAAEQSADVAFLYPATETIPTGAQPAISNPLPQRERPRFTSDGKRVGWNVERIGAARVWRELGVTGDGATVAVLDVGANYGHHDLRDNIWRNPREEPNGRDDDGNGYVDDLHGFDFAAMSPNVLDQADRQHGTMTSGIVAGDGTLGIVTGLAPRARLMELVAGDGTSSALAFQYAIEQGADVMSMSFSLRALPDNLRGFWRMMCDHAVAAGLVLAGGAGNFQQNAQVPRQHFAPKDVPSVISVGGVDSLDALAPFSSLGPAEWSTVALYHDYPMPNGITKPDLVAFPEGYPLLGMTDTVYIESNGPRGNSFSGPHAAGAAALILSAAPWLPAWRVKLLLEETARDLEAPGKDNRTGAGLIDAYAAVSRARSMKAPAR